MGEEQRIAAIRDLSRRILDEVTRVTGDDTRDRQIDLLAAYVITLIDGARDGAIDRVYPCDRCGKMRTKAEGGTVFTVCDACWDALPPEAGV